MKKGYTLTEVLIVVAIVVLLAAIAIPNILKAKADESTKTRANFAIATQVGSFGSSYPLWEITFKGHDYLSTTDSQKASLIHSESCPCKAK